MVDRDDVIRARVVGFCTIPKQKNTEGTRACCFPVVRFGNVLFFVCLYFPHIHWGCWKKIGRSKVWKKRARKHHVVTIANVLFRWQSTCIYENTSMDYTYRVKEGIPSNSLGTIAHASIIRILCEMCFYSSSASCPLPALAGSVSLALFRQWFLSKSSNILWTLEPSLRNGNSAEKSKLAHFRTVKRFANKNVSCRFRVHDRRVFVFVCGSSLLKIHLSTTFFFLLFVIDIAITDAITIFSVWKMVSMSC